MPIYVALLSVVIVAWLAYRWKKLSLWQNLGIPGPKPNLIFGNILELYIKGPLKCHENWVKKYGRVLGYFYGMKPVLLVSDPYILKNIFIRDFNNFIEREVNNPLEIYDPTDNYHQSISKLHGQAWKDLRSVLNRSFTPSKMKEIMWGMESAVETMLEILENKARKRISFDILAVYQMLTLDIIQTTAFGIQSDVQKNKEGNLLHIVRLTFNHSYRDMLIFFGLTFPILRSLCIRLRLLIIALRNMGQSPYGTIRKRIHKVIKMRRNNPESRKNDLLQLMLDSSSAVSSDVCPLAAGNSELKKKKSFNNMKARKLTEAEVECTALSIFLAGYETTSTTLAFATYLIAKHQDVQEKIFQEIKGVVQLDQKLDYSTIQKLYYMEKVLQESLRMYPTGILFSNRYSFEDVHYGDIHIPKGTLIQAPVNLMHHDPEFWSEPEIFDPERFSIKPNREGITYLPYGVGPRNCLGASFAQCEMKLALANVIYKFRIQLDEKQMDNLEVFCRSRTMATNKVFVKLEPRTE